MQKCKLASFLCHVIGCHGNLLISFSSCLQKISKNFAICGRKSFSHCIRLLHPKRFSDGICSSKACAFEHHTPSSRAKAALSFDSRKMPIVGSARHTISTNRFENSNTSKLGCIFVREVSIPKCSMIGGKN